MKSEFGVYGEYGIQGSHKMGMRYLHAEIWVQ